MSKHGALLTKLSKTQTYQGKMLTSMNTKMDNLIHGLIGSPLDVSQSQSQTQPQMQEEEAPNTSHGTTEGMES